MDGSQRRPLFKSNTAIAVGSSLALHALALVLLLAIFPTRTTLPNGRLSTVDFTDRITQKIRHHIAKHFPSVEKEAVVTPQIAAPLSNDGNVSGKAAATESQNAPDSQNPGETRESAENRYVANLSKLLSLNKQYPREAILREQEGLVVISVWVDREGIVHESKVETPSPFRLLNEAAMATVEKVGRFPAPPLSLLGSDGLHGSGSLRLKVPISFRLQR